MTRVERSLFYPAVESNIGTNEIYNPIPLHIVIVMNHHSSTVVSRQSSTSVGKSSLRSTAPYHQSAGTYIIALVQLYIDIMALSCTHRTWEQPWQTTTVLACEKTVVMVKQPGHLTSMKNERGAGTRVLSLCLRASLYPTVSCSSGMEFGSWYVRGRAGVEKVDCENL